MSPISAYAALLGLHRAAVAASLILFAARGVGVHAGRGWPMEPLIRRASVAIDIVLLVAGLSLWRLLRLDPLRDAWFGAKLVCIVIYIVAGSYALKRASSRRTRAAFLAAAMLLAAWIVGVALARDPLGWLKSHPPFDESIRGGLALGREPVRP